MRELLEKAAALLKAEGYTVQDPKKMTREDIIKIKDHAERQKAIAENMELFQKK